MSLRSTSQPPAEPPPERLYTRIVTVFALLAILPLVAGAIISLVIGIWLTRSDSADHQQHDAQLVGELIGQRWAEELAGLRAAAQALGEAPESLGLIQQNCRACQSLAIIDRAGQVLHLRGQPLPLPVADLLAQADEMALRPQPLRYGNDLAIVLAFPTHSGGLLLALANPQALGQPVLAAARSERHGYAYVVDATGQLIISPQPAEVLPGRSMRTVPAVAAALAGHDWQPPTSQAYRGLLDQRVEGAWARVPNTGWYVLVELPLAIVNTSNWYFFVAQALLLIGTMLAAIVLGRRLAATVTTPIERLQSGVARLRVGNWHQPLAVGRRDEIGQLAEDFNAMAGDLQAKQTELTRRGDELALMNHELAQALEAARTANNLKSQFVATISHELRTPLTGVLGYADMLEMGVYGPLEGELLEVVQRIRTNGRHLLNLINDLLDFSKLEAGKLELHPQNFDLHEFLASSVASCEPQAQAKGLALAVRIDPALPPQLRGDVLRLRQIVLNLLSNAIKFTEQGLVSIQLSPAEVQPLAPSAHSAEQTGRYYLQIDVVDTGIGIAPANHALIFNAFRQLDGSYSRRSEGTGLGLSITRRLVELMGGVITVSSAPGEGSRFGVVVVLGQAELAP